jgi:hypothetical protein
MHRSKNVILFTLIVQTLLLSIYEGFLYLHGMDASGQILKLCGYIYIILLIMWVDLDSKGRSNIQRCFDYKFLIALFWIPYLPYYFIKTRGFLIGSSMIIGLVIMFEFSNMVKFLLLQFF